ncbi:hypothetical protein CROQUDRAFT_654048 [Cronartium quercuum f. sp. fusiforme G11]|uniref:Uncharacterized protein n=1 Tax=Cronartium quercuum f. sp. fusiforme G11 TaxID=708437 RepID=A0A9P6NN59_9BASI|nr:hypothetical protein CROQUDRAFT_654048 [Cronartium quercuum f. sp. fusiforme G11]
MTDTDQREPKLVHSLSASESASMPTFTKPSRPQPGPSILLNPLCPLSSNDDPRLTRAGSRFAQLSCALKKAFVNLPSPHGDHQPNVTTLPHSRTSHDPVSDHPPTSASCETAASKLQSKQVDKMDVVEDGSSQLTSVSLTTSVRSPVIKFAPLPQIHNRNKRANSITLGVSSRALMLQCAKEGLPNGPKPGANILSSSLPPRQRPEWPVETTASAHPPTANPASKPKRSGKRKGKKERQRQRIEMETAGLEGMDAHGRQSSSLSGSSASDCSGRSGSIFEDCVERRGSVSSAGHTSITSGLSDKVGGDGP